MKFKKGKSGNPAGRQKGTVNENNLTNTFKGLLIKTILDLEEKGECTLAKFAVDNPKEFYMIAARLIPTELMGGTENKIIVTIQEAPDMIE